MADEIFSRDSNFVPVAGAVTDDSNEEVRMWRIDDTTKGVKVVIVGGTGVGDVSGPASSTDNAIARFNGIDGKTIQNSGVTISDANVVLVPSLTASEILITDASKNLVSAAVATYPSLTELTYLKGTTSALQTQITAKAPSTSPTFATSITGSYLTASEILITDGSKNIVSAAVATYPSLTELTYVKGVTSAIQTQLGTKQATITFGTNVQTALGVNIGSAGAPVLFDGALGTPSSGVATNLTGTASGLTAGTVTTNANLTGIVTSTGNATAIADKAISYTKLADGTDGNLITWDASGVAALVATGTATHVLTSNGAGAAPTFQAVSSGTTVTTALPRPVAVVVADGVSGMTLNTNTTMYVGLIQIPFAITANKLTTYWSSTTTDGTVDITLYSESGASQIFSVTTASLTGTDFLETTALSAVSIPAGQYYLAVNTNSTANLVGFGWQQNNSATPFGTTNGILFDVASEAVYQGTVTITAGTPPATIDPTAITQATGIMTLLIRLDN